MSLQRVTHRPSGRDRTLFDRAATRALESAALAGTPAHALMQRAGRTVARLALAIAPHARHLQIACGPGNNGGDGLVAAMWLKRMGREVSVHHLGAGAAPDDAAWALHAAAEAGVLVEPGLQGVDADFYIDALLGLGATRALQGAMASWAQYTRGRPLLAVDLPSGLDVDTGMPWPDGSAISATHTLSLLTLKPGLFTARGRDHAGEVWFDDLGVNLDGASPVACLFDGCEPVFAARPHASHKGSLGDVVVIGGAEGMSGAAVLAAEAALAAGAGRVYLSLLVAGAAGTARPRPELMTRKAWWRADPATLALATAVCGCGGGQAVAATLPPLLAAVPRLVLDADALNAVAADPVLAGALAARDARGLVSIITPHPLEAARLLGVGTAVVMADRLAAARELAERLRCTVVLKGSGSIVAAPGRVPSINASGNASLATPGSGDVLAGWIGGRWAAAGAAPSAWDIAREAVWWHGHAADRHGAATPLRAADLIEAMHRAATQRAAR